MILTSLRCESLIKLKPLQNRISYTLLIHDPRLIVAVLDVYGQSETNLGEQVSIPRLIANPESFVRCKFKPFPGASDDCK